MSTKFKVLIAIVFLVSCGHESRKQLVVYPLYCSGCIIKNFEAMKEKKYTSEFEVYFDTTDQYLLTNAVKNGLHYHHCQAEEIPQKFGDFANLVVIDPSGKTRELRTNEVIQKGVHF